MKKTANIHDPSFTDTFSRRTFLSGGAAAFSGMIVAPHLVRGATANGKIAVGMIGCGGRGGWIANHFKAHGGYEITACADYFQDKVDAFGEKHGIDASRRFTGLNGYKKLLECGNLDTVIIKSPPCFHPQQIADAVDAGKHVYAAKPVAVDAPGCRTVAESGKRATKNKQVVFVDFQHRNDPFLQETVKRLHEGVLGKITFGEAFNHSGECGVKPGPDTPETRLKNWLLYKALSGDYMVEINIHSVDMMHWMMQKPPLSAIGSGGRTSKSPVGDNWDYLGVLYQYANDVPVTFTSKRYNDGAGEQDKHHVIEIYGTDGRLYTTYAGRCMILGRNPYKGGKTTTLYRDGAVANIALFHTAVTTGDYSNSTVEYGVESNLIAIMGRTAGYEKRLVTWDEILKSDDKMDLQLDGLKA
jgi:predicted dehydrogenase